jgi:hypothetical protein
MGPHESLIIGAYLFNRAAMSSLRGDASSEYLPSCISGTSRRACAVHSERTTGDDNPSRGDTTKSSTDRIRCESSISQRTSLVGFNHTITAELEGL